MLVAIRGDSIVIFGDLDKASVTEQDNVLQQISELLGITIRGVTLSGCWVIIVDDEVVSGDKLKGQRRRRHLSNALADGLNRVVTTQI